MRAQMVSKFLHEIPQTPILVRVGTLCRWKNPRECESVPENESKWDRTSSTDPAINLPNVNR